MSTNVRTALIVICLWIVAYIGFAVVGGITDRADKKASDEKASLKKQLVDKEIIEFTKKYNAENFTKPAFGDFMLNVQEEIIRFGDKPVLIRGFMKDIFMDGNDVYVVVSSISIPEMYYYLKTNLETAHKLKERESARFDENYFIIKTKSSKRIDFAMTGEKNSEDAYVTMEPAEALVVRGEMIDFLTTET